MNDTELNEPNDELTDAERVRRTATLPSLDWRYSRLDPKTLTMVPPRGEEPVVVLSRGI